MSKTPPTLRKRFYVAGGAIGLFILTLAVAGPILDPSPDGKLVLGYDFLPSYVAGHFARTAEFAKMYDRVAFCDMQTRIIEQANLEMDGRYGAGLNPPHFALFYAPLSALPYRTAAALWLVMNVALLAGSLALLVQMVPGDRWTKGLVPLLLLASMPFCQAMGHQQNTFLSLLILTTAVTFWRSRSAFLAGLAIGLLFYKPQLALVVSIVLVADLGWRAALGLGTAGMVTFLVTMTFMPGALSEYLHTFPLNVDWIQNQPRYNWARQATFLGFWRMSVTPHVARILWGAGAAAFGGALIFALLRSRRALHPDRLIAATIAATPLLLPYFMDYDLLLLAVPAVLMAREVLLEGGAATLTRADRWTTRAWVALYLWTYLNPGLSGTLRVSLTVPLLACVAAGLIARCGRREQPVARSEAEPPAPPQDARPLPLAA